MTRRQAELGLNLWTQTGLGGVKSLGCLLDEVIISRR